MGELGKWEMADPIWMPHTAQQGYFGVGWGLYFTLVHLKAWEWLAVVIVILLEVTYQIVQALVPSSVNLYFGGEGFSYSNLIYGCGGMLLGLFIDLAAPPHVRPWNSDPCSDKEGKVGYDACWAEYEATNGL